MQVFEHVYDVREYIKERIASGKKVGFVPTMGALHEGHISLLNKAKQENDIVVCSIYVNPTQFNNAEDLKNYPSPIENDKKKLIDAHCDILYLPQTKEIYPTKDPKVIVDFGEMERTLEGEFRPGHFKGVGLIITKLFNIIKPAKAYFGEKDFQQLALIRNLADEFMFDTEIIGVDTMREKDGLAMSSRNLRLNEEERKISPIIYKALKTVEENLKNGDIEQAIEKGKAVILSNSKLTLEYLRVVDAYTLKDMENTMKTLTANICIAAHLGPVRLIDNIRVEL
ncbi:pantoate--beta-alanine ligase [Aureibacter tunicatorum]|uniref:Pantothenate synthetase n=1 Tax=Aureibacter tunicatorum TaxID=866807 RepID=A0AAE4BNY1_9BACT|nr:pantoate--beta-alanine ligase [Aureibacter tunicatorum]MDR6237339.1 pantoate--beta-alanine ligase [Aureibacter tunicatorum]BDD06330.1 pantothenate synthetase [Aureibacter tunicatorum]